MTAVRVGHAPAAYEIAPVDLYAKRRMSNTPPIGWNCDLAGEATKPPTGTKRTTTEETERRDNFGMRRTN